MLAVLLFLPLTQHIVMAEQQVMLGDTFNCLKLDGVIQNGEESGITHSKVEETGVSYKVYGITSYCYIYAGWVHELIDKDDLDQSRHEIDKNERGCKKKQVVLMHTEGLRERVLLVIDRFGRRVRVQSAVSGAALESAGFVWMKLNHKDRKQHFFTGPIPEGYVIQSFVNINYRVYIVAIGTEDIKLFEIRVFSGSNRLKPYIKGTNTTGQVRHSITIKAAYVTPRIGLFARAVHDMQFGPNFARNGSTTRHYNVSGLMFSHNLDLYQPLAPVAPALPMDTIFKDSFYQYNGAYPNTRFVYKRSDDRDLLIRLPNSPECAEWLNYFMLYLHQVNTEFENDPEFPEYTIASETKPSTTTELMMSGRDWENYVEPVKPAPVIPDKKKLFNISEPESSLFSISKKMYINEETLHRRMAYPHATYTHTDRKIMSKGWKELSPVLGGTIGGIVVVSLLINILLHQRRKAQRRRGITSSLSNNTF